ncbi:MAG TPA: hypothetical protein VMV26_07935 [Alphaproteobacteria bacterium]|jgi:hypothetical protein|nr:hypothetical protein [Alphaproteobacteria bacterium]
MTRWIVAAIALVAAPAPAAADGLLLELAGSPGLRVKGSCRLIEADGVPRDATLDSLVPHRFEIDAVAASCTLNKMDERGTLRASLSLRGQIVALFETTALFGGIAVRTDGPWGPARGRESAALFRRGHGPGVPGTGQGPTVPPLGGTTVPPLRGTTVPPLR